MGAGLAGLSAGCVLTRAGENCTVVEGDLAVGGLSRTIEHDGFRFDLGGHRFITKTKATENFVRDLLGHECRVVPRTSQIHMRGRYFNYPLTPANALFGMGLATTFRILADYALQNARNLVQRPVLVSLEDWVVSKFGRALFELYFKEYSEKVWGVDCRTISKEWVSRRIEGLSLWKAIKNAFSKRSGGDINTLADSFLYPAAGIGLIADRLQQAIEARSPIRTNTKVLRVEHDGFLIKSIMVQNGDDLYDLAGSEFISSIPLTALIRALHPAPPAEVRQAVAALRYRDLIVSTIMLDREQVTDLTWMYLPEKTIPFGRIHEPKNWSRDLAPEGKTHIVAEYFCFQQDAVWKASDEAITASTVEHLAHMGFIRKREVIGSCVVRAPRAYPLFHVGYERHYETIMAYLKQFKNLQVIGRGGMFRYHNMDHAMESGIDAANEVLHRQPRLEPERAMRIPWRSIPCHFTRKPEEGRLYGGHDRKSFFNTLRH